MLLVKVDLAMFFGSLAQTRRLNCIRKTAKVMATLMTVSGHLGLSERPLRGGTCDFA